MVFYLFAAIFLHKFREYILAKNTLFGMKKLLLILITCAAYSYGQAQTAYQVAPKQYNLSSVSTEKKVVTQELTERTPLALQTHPEYGVNPYNAPCTDCIEVLEKRTESSRYFITNNKGGSEFYVQQAYGAMHYKNAQNQWVTIDTRLKPSNTPHLFTAANQPMPVKIDAGLGFTSITRLGAEFKFNRDMELFYTADGVTTTSMGKANWTNYTVGDDGVKVIDAWPGIDMVLKVNKGQVESDFIVKQALGTTQGRYLIRDYAQLPTGFYYSGITPGEPMFGEYSVLTATGEEAFHINRAFAFEGAEPNDPYYLAYNYSAQNGYVDIELPAQWINNPARQYPVTIDPLVTASGSLSFTVDITGSGYDPVCFQNGCQYPLSVMVPAACTVTDITNSFQYNTFGGCVASNGAISINYGACKWPQTGIPTGCTLPGPCTWSGFSIYNDLQACIPAPQCAGYAMPFTLNFFRCASPGGCSSTCIGASQNWVMTVKGKTVETLSITGAQANICPGTPVNLQITPTGGVAPYSIVWNPGGLTGSPVTVNPTTNTLYTATVTDACGNTITSNNTVNVTIQSGTNNPGFSIGTANICAGVPFNLFGGGGGVANGYDWVITGSNQPTVNNSQNVTALSFATAGSYSITLNYNNNGCFNPLTQNITVNPVVTPVVAITANPSGPVCSGACVNFTAVVTNGGTGTISWRKNGSLISSATLPAGTTLNYCNYVNGDIMTAEVTNNAACVNPATGTSNQIVMQVTATVVPGATITQSPANPVCPGTPVTFTATPVNGGSSPTYVWQLNGALQPSTPSNTFTVNAPANGNQVAVTITSSLPPACVFPSTGFSNVLTITTAGTVTPSVTLTQNPVGPICPGQNVTFTATPTNGGSAPLYEFFVNNVSQGAPSSSTTFSSNSLTNGAVVRVALTSNAPCPTTPTVNSANITMTVNPTLTPSVTITPNPAFPVCAGTGITFTATPTNGGATPQYQWKLNGGNVGSNSATYTNAGLVNGDVVSVVLTSNATCVSPTTATSNTVTASFTAQVTPTVTITANPGNTVCTGTSVTYTATSTNGGAAPAYQWKRNGTNVGTGTTYTNATPANGDVITCVLTSNDPCANPTTATSNAITMVVNPVVVPSVTIAANPGNTICAGQSVTFTATPTNGGAAPLYEWFINNVSQGAASASATFTTTALANNDVVRVTLTSNATCVSPTTATSSTITMTVNTVLTPSVAIAANPAGAICSGTNVTFTATPTNGGGAPTYEWFINNVSQGAPSASNTFSSAALANGQTVRVTMTSNATCVSPSTATSSNITITVNTTLTPAVTITANPGNTICQGTAVTFTASVTSGGTTPTYQWYSGNNPINNATNPTYLTNSLANGEQISVRIVSSDPCANPTNATSNTITMTVNPNVTPSVTVSSNPGSPVCQGASVTFTATPTNGGTAPTYQWFVGGTPLPPPYNTAVVTPPAGTIPAGTANITVQMTSNAPCASPTAATSPVYPFTVNPLVPPTATISVSPNTPVCAGSNLTFTAVAGTAGTAPTYQWYNGATPIAGATNSTYSSTGLTNGQQISVVVTSNDPCAAPLSAQSAPITVQIISQLIPSVGIAALPASPICAGTSVTFTATPTNGGLSPTYQWFINNVLQGPASASNTFTSATLANGDIITVVMTSSEPCANPTTATSNAVTMTVNPVQTPTVSIAAAPASPICAGTSVTFTATPTNGGAAPTYQWLNNGVPIVPAQTAATYTTTTLTSADNISVRMTSNVACPSPATVTSNVLNYVVNPVPVPSVTLAANPNTPICPGASVTFTATPTNGGAAPLYEFFVNNVSQGVASASATFTSTTLANGDAVNVTMTSNALCASPTTATSANVTVTVLTVTTPTVTFTQNPAGAICAGQNVTFTATPTFGGPTPTYQWAINGNPQPGSSATFSTTALANNDAVTVTLTSSQPCASPITVTSTPPLTVTVNPILVPTVTVVDNPTGTVCQGTPITFTATPTNEGTTPTYQWFVNNVPVPASNSPIYTNNNPANGDVVKVTLTSSEQCAQPQAVTSTDITLSVVSTVVPTVSVTPSQAMPVCDNTAITFTADTAGGGPAPTFQWLVNNTPQAATGTTLSYTPANGDNISVVMTSNAQCANPATATANINASTLPYLDPTITITSNPATSVCLGQTVTFTATVADAGTSPFIQWYVGGSMVGTNATTYVSNTINPGDIIIAEVTSSYQCVNTPVVTSNQIQLTFNPPITVTITPSAATVCAGVKTLLTATATGGDGGPYTLTWDDGTQGDAIQVSPNSTTSYTVSATDGCGTTPGTATATVTVIPTPVANFTFSPDDKVTTLDDVFFDNQSSNADWWTWDFGDNTALVDTVDQPYHNFENPSSYQVTLYAYNASGCTDTIVRTIEVKEQAIFYVPNSFTPNKDGKNELFRVYTTNVDLPYTLVIYARNGEEVYNSEKDAPIPGAIYWTGQKHNDGDVLPEGVYVYYLYIKNPYLNKNMWTKRGRITMLTGESSN